MNWKTNLTWALIVITATPLIIFIVPQFLGMNAYIINSSSMEPTLKPGDIVYTEEVEPRNLEENDVIVFQPNQSRFDEKRVVHRIVSVNITDTGYAFGTKGDANPAKDPGLTPDYRVIGASIMSVPYIGYYIWFVESTPLIMMLVIIPAAILIRSEILTFLEEKNE